MKKTVVCPRFPCPLVSHDKVLVVTHKNSSKKLSIPVYRFTLIGIQILELGSFKPVEEYLRIVGKELIKSGYKVELADYIRQTEGKWTYKNSEKLDSA
jgi:hypothetical protein